MNEHDDFIPVHLDIKGTKKLNKLVASELELNEPENLQDIINEIFNNDEVYRKTNSTDNSIN